jgi:hypothetical protein
VAQAFDLGNFQKNYLKKCDQIAQQIVMQVMPLLFSNFDQQIIFQIWHAKTCSLDINSCGKLREARNKRFPNRPQKVKFPLGLKQTKAHFVWSKSLFFSLVLGEITHNLTRNCFIKIISKC